MLNCYLNRVANNNYIILLFYDNNITMQFNSWFLHFDVGIAFLQAGEEMGYEIRDTNSEIQTGYGLYQFTMRRGYRCSSSKAFLQPIRLRRNLHVALWSHVTKVLIDPDSKRAYGVEFERDGRRRVALAKREVILSAGAINSPQLLMLSGENSRLYHKYYYIIIFPIGKHNVILHFRKSIEILSVTKTLNK